MAARGLRARGVFNNIAGDTAGRGFRRAAGIDQAVDLQRRPVGAEPRIRIQFDLRIADAVCGVALKRPSRRPVEQVSAFKRA